MVWDENLVAIRSEVSFMHPNWGVAGNLLWLMKSRALSTEDCLVGAAVALVDSLVIFQGTAPV